MKRVFRLESAVVFAEKALLVAFLFFLVALSFLQVLMRLFFSSGFMWADSLLRHGVMWAGFLGAALASYYGKHFALDAIVKFLPPGARKACETSVHVFTAAVCAFLASASLKFIKDEISSRSTAFDVGGISVPAAWLEIIIPAGFVLILFHTAMHIFRKDIP